MIPLSFLFTSQVLWMLGLILLAVSIIPSFRVIGPTEVGLLTKRFSGKKLSENNPIAFNDEAGYQADLLMPGLRWLVQRAKEDHSLTVEVTGDDVADIPEPISILLFQAVRELLLNVVKHAGVDAASVGMEQPRASVYFTFASVSHASAVRSRW